MGRHPERKAAQAAPPEVVERVRAELRRDWWRTTLLISLPLAVAVVLGYVVALEVRDGDLLAIAFPGVVVAWCTWVGLTLVRRAIATSRAEARLDEGSRAQAVYVRGLAGTTRLAAAQDQRGFEVLDGMWVARSGRVTGTTIRSTRRSSRGPGDDVLVDVSTTDGPDVTAWLIADRADIPAIGSRVRLLEDPWHPRCVVDLRPVRD